MREPSPLYRIQKETAIYRFSAAAKPASRVPQNQDVVFETFDCFGNQLQSAQSPFCGVDWDRINPATGPVFVEGAAEGDILEVHILQIDLGPTGLGVAGKGLGPMGKRLEDMYLKAFRLEDGHTRFKDLHFALRPMIGVIGVAPARGREVSCGTPGAHGGNMDCTEARAGHCLYFPVAVEGALFALGDLHGAMGDGEIGGSGLEIGGEVRVRFRVLKNGPALSSPLIAGADKIMVVSSAPSLDTAAEEAVCRTVDLLKETTALSQAEATLFLSLRGHLRICQIVDPEKTVRMEVGRADMEALGYRGPF